MKRQRSLTSMADANHAKHFVSENFCRLNVSGDVNASSIISKDIESLAVSDYNNQIINMQLVQQHNKKEASESDDTMSLEGVSRNEIEAAAADNVRSTSPSIEILSEDAAKILHFGPVRPLRRQRHSSHYVDYLVDDLVRKTRRLAWQSNISPSPSTALDLISLPTVGPHPLTDHHHLSLPKSPVSDSVPKKYISHGNFFNGQGLHSTSQTHAHEVSHSDWFMQESANADDRPGQPVKSDSEHSYADVDESITDDECDVDEDNEEMQT